MRHQVDAGALLAGLHRTDEFLVQRRRCPRHRHQHLLYEVFGGHSIVLALVWPFGFALHGITVHLFWTIRQNNLSPGLATSAIYWIMAGFFVRYGFLPG